MIERLHVRNYKGLRDVELVLGPISVLIGPNDSGKTSVLEAIGAMCRSVDEPLGSAFRGPWSGLDLVSDRDPEKAVELKAAFSLDGAATEYGFSCEFRPPHRAAVLLSEWISSAGGAKTDFPSKGHDATFVNRIARKGSQGSDEIRALARLVYRELRGVQDLHLDPRMLALPVAADSTSSFTLHPSGFGLARCLDEILGVDRDRFGRIEAGLRTIFPGFRSIRLAPQPAFRAPQDISRDVPSIQQADGKGIELAFEGVDSPVPASQLSDGMLMIVAYLTVLNLPTPARLLLIEEPENGIHPHRLREVVRLFREFVIAHPETQVVMTSHSPYVVDLFRPEEVYACTLRRDTGVSITRLSDSEVVREQIRHFTLGEIWSAEGEERLMNRSPGEPAGR